MDKIGGRGRSISCYVSTQRHAFARAVFAFLGEVQSDDV